MTKINTSLIEGYEEMTAEEKLAALESYELDGYVSKSVFDKTAKEAAEFKRQLRAKQTDEENLKQQRDEEIETMKQELETLKKEKQLSELTSNFLGLGFDETLAQSTAKAQLEGNMGVVFANYKKFNESIEKKVKAELIKNTPQPGAGSGNDKKTIEDLKKMSIEERAKFSMEHPEEYKEIYGGNN